MCGHDTSVFGNHVCGIWLAGASETTFFFYFQRGKRRNSGWIAAGSVWDESKTKLQQELLSSGKHLVLYVDCSSWKIETVALEQALKKLEKKTLNIEEVVHDDNDQLKAFCKDNKLQTSGNKLQLVQRASVFLNLPEARASTELQRQRPFKYPELAQHDLAYKLKSWKANVFTCSKNVTARRDVTL
ncbi:hypothetical protein R1sor_007293 [Riccia sorocarpa]|uniref:SAP domain-containing protein n=1 Tax=Riccia sorocarpa TaxID=122646 RepID=A0ABD3HTJ4_9MARC